MKISEKVKPRVSWAQGPKLCQVKLFRKEECPSKVGPQPQPQPQNFSKHSSEEPDLPPGFENYHALKPNVSNIPQTKWKQPLKVKLFQKEDCPSEVGPPPQPHNFSKHSSGEPDLPQGFENYCAVKPNVSNIPHIKWKRPRLKFSFNHAWRVADGSESTERETEHLRISKVLEAFYPHPSSIPSQPAVSRAVEAERFDDSKTPVIPLTSIEDKLESKEESSHSTVESGFSAFQELASRLAPALSLLVKEHGSMIDTDLLVKILSDPEMVKNLLADTTVENQHFTNQEQRVLASHQPFTNPEQRRASPPMPGNGNISSLRPINEQPMHAWLPSSSCVGKAKEQPLSAWLPSSSLPSQPMTTKDHVKNLIKEHRKDHQNHSRFTNDKKVRKQCIYYGTTRGCRNGDGCLFVHNRFRPNTEVEAPRAKRYKFGRYDQI